MNIRYLLALLLLVSGLAQSSFAQKKGFNTLIAEHSFTDLEGKQLPLSDIFAAHKGKVIYVDFWASWCVPCLHEMPHSKALRQYLQDNTNIVFVYLSIDDTDEPWKKAIDKQQISATGLHYRRSREDIAPLMKQLYIYTIPHYWIIGKDGLPYELNTFPPSDKKMGKLLSKLADE